MPPLSPEFKVGDRIQELSQSNNISPGIWVVNAVHGNEVTCGKGAETKKLHIDSLIKTEEPAVATIADLCLTDGWRDIEKNDPALFTTIMATIRARGWDQAYKESMKLRSWKLLLRRLETADATGLLALADAARIVLGSQLLDLKPTQKSNKDPSVQDPSLSTSEVLKRTHPTGYVTKCNNMCLTRAMTWDTGIGSPKPKQRDRVTGDAFFLRVSVEESRKIKFKDIVDAIGGQTFTEKEFDRAASWMQKKAKDYVKRLMPGYDYNGIKPSKKSLDVYKTLHGIAKLIPVLWLLGITDSMQGDISSKAKLFFVFLLYSRGKRLDEYFMEKIRKACENVTMTPRYGFTLLEGNPKKNLKMKDRMKTVAAVIKYAFSETGDLQQLENATDAFVQECKRDGNKKFNDPASQPLVIEHQCMVLQQSAISFLAKLFGSRLKKPPPEDEVQKAFHFLEGIHEVHPGDDGNRMLQEYQKPKDSRKPWNKTNFPTVNCTWKHDKRSQQKMLVVATGYKAAKDDYEPHTRNQTPTCGGGDSGMMGQPDAFDEPRVSYSEGAVAED
ncbi:hypothetical protein NCLIV_011020 [Neospora caninum Liverpool]|uniref:Uncharacterized protein n=1 Tax=Neospora caninum (strain Liverpool) TaxID=572307 RepID=F0VAE5_NEOCL|nr:hypothetical protein NCLIV_011020 [Neospora caninum Liverpool]CBZ50634.1 hypothetical protein NCLIV_011020 [Neospora caninum Liverpool]CEL65246.1 TPA: hypothetical protein BN1204_011020 [Neospora caninum Liverpool]|eukprot:XP_003880667.1 hypothetical protein NCLIV_011020 [Neospora caninum Liverpool]